MEAPAGPMEMRKNMMGMRQKMMAEDQAADARLEELVNRFVCYSAHVRRTVLLLLLAVVTTLTAADGIWCPDGCLDHGTTWADSDHGGAATGSCLQCANGLHPGPRFPPPLGVERADAAVAPRAPGIPMMPPRSVDHPPA